MLNLQRRWDFNLADSFCSILKTYIRKHRVPKYQGSQAALHKTFRLHGPPTGLHLSKNKVITALLVNILKGTYSECRVESSCSILPKSHLGERWVPFPGSGQWKEWESKPTATSRSYSVAWSSGDELLTIHEGARRSPIPHLGEVS